MIRAQGTVDKLAGHYINNSWIFVYTTKLIYALFMNGSQWRRVLIGREEILPIYDQEYAETVLPSLY